MILVMLSLCPLVNAEVAKTEGFFAFKEVAPLGVALDKAFVGRDGDTLLVLGGFIEQAVSHSVYYLAKDASKWSALAPLQDHIYGGAAVSHADGVICVGGFKNNTLSKVVIRYSIEDGQLQGTSLPDLPMGIEDVKAALVSDRLYALGSDVVYSLDLLTDAAVWEPLDSWQPSPAKIIAAVGVADRLYVFTHDEHFKVMRLTGNNGFELLGETDYDLSEMFAAPCGQGHVVFVSKSGQSDDILAYHTITNQWVLLGKLPHTVDHAGIVFTDVTFDIIGSDASVNVKAINPPTKYGWVDHAVVAVFIVGMLLIGAYLSKREKSSADYFRGGNRIPWWASGLSLFATGSSAITLMAMPGKAFSTDWVYLTVTFYSVMTILPICVCVYVPIARRLNVATANEYLERRFNVFLRMAGSIIWSLIQILGRMAAIMILPAIAISSITGLSIETCIIIMGVVTTCYVFLGGLEGVIWTDVLQAFVMILAVVVSAGWALFSLTMSPNEALATIQSAQKLHMFDWQITFLEPCVMILFLNILITTLGQIGDQNFIQRVQCTATEKEAKKAVITSIAVSIPLNGILFALGTALFLFYMEKPEMLSPAVKSDGIFPLFAAQNLPVGLAGLIIAAILAATMSTLSSAINSVANLGVDDFYRRFKKDASDHSCVILGRVLTLSLGIFGTVAALFLAKTDLASIWDLYMVILGVLFGAITGIFTLGIFTQRANSIGAILGVIASLAATYYARTSTHLHFLSYPIVGVVACFVVGYIFSIIIPTKQKEITGLTVYTLPSASDD